MTLAFTVSAPPHGKGRARGTASGRHYTPQKTRAYEALVRAEAQDAMRRHGIQALSGALRMSITVRIMPPESASKKARADMLTGVRRPTVKPDCSNVCKAVEDAINGVAYRDDVLITELAVSKVYATHTGVDVVIERIGCDHKGG